MKVMHFHFGKYGGAERFFVHLVNALGRRGVEQRSVIRPGRTWRKDIEAATRIHESHFRDASLDRLLLPWRIQREARAWRPDAMISWMPRAARVLPREPLALRLARLGDYPTELRRVKNVDALVCNTPGIAEHVRKMGWNRGVEVISNFTNMQRVAPVDREALGAPPGRRLVCTMGRLVPRKGIDVVIQAVAALEDTHLWIIGDGPEAANLRALAKELGVADRIQFLGWQSDPRAHLAAADVFAMASSHEPLGNIVLEAWAQRVPVVATRCEGPSWYMRDGENGLLVDIGDQQGLAAAIERISQYGELARALVTGGCDTLHRQFSEEAVTGAYLRLFDGCVAKAA